MTTTRTTRKTGFQFGPEGLLPAAELDLLQRLRTLVTNFRDGRDPEKVLHGALRLGLSYFGAETGCVAVAHPAGDSVELLYTLPRDAGWDRDELLAFVRGGKVPPQGDRMLARVRRRGRLWGVLGLHRPDAHWRWDARRAWSSVAATATEVVTRIDLERSREVRSRIDRKIIEQIRPKDLFYQILRGLRPLTDYDHSSALLIMNERDDALEIVAEQIAWRKGKGAHVGQTQPLTPELAARLREGDVQGFDRHRPRGAWMPWTEDGAIDIANLLDYDEDADGVAARSMLCAPLVARNRVQGILKIASIHPRALQAYEADLVSRFLPQVSVALQNAQRTESLEAQVLAAERRSAMADLARGVSHDVNNALGAVIPLVQELREEAVSGELDPKVVAGDLEEVDRSLRVCRRIFTGMLDFACGNPHHTGDVRLSRVVETTMAIMRDGLQRRGVVIDVDVPRNLPAVRGIQAELEQLLLNLVANARDALADGGTLTIHAAPDDSGNVLVLTVCDTGTGIPPELLARIQEPFFTTKEHGHGLGLAICRSIVSQLRGRIVFASQPGHGTLVTVRLPIAEGTDG